MQPVWSVQFKALLKRVHALSRAWLFCFNFSKTDKAFLSYPVLDEQEPHTKLVKLASTIQPRQSSIIQLDSVPADPSVLPPSVPLTRCASADFYGTTDSLALPELPLNVGRASPISRGGSVSPSYANKALSRRSSLITLSATAGLDGTEAQVPYVELPDRTHDPIIPALAEVRSST